MHDDCLNTVSISAPSVSIIVLVFWNQRVDVRCTHWQCVQTNVRTTGFQCFTGWFYSSFSIWSILTTSLYLLKVPKQGLLNLGTLTWHPGANPWSSMLFKDQNISQVSKSSKRDLLEKLQHPVTKMKQSYWKGPFCAHKPQPHLT